LLPWLKSRECVNIDHGQVRVVDPGIKFSIKEGGLR